VLMNAMQGLRVQLRSFERSGCSYVHRVELDKSVERRPLHWSGKEATDPKPALNGSSPRLATNCRLVPNTARPGSRPVYDAYVPRPIASEPELPAHKSPIPRLLYGTRSSIAFEHKLMHA